MRGGEVCGGFLSSKNLMFIPMLKVKAKSKGKLGLLRVSAYKLATFFVSIVFYGFISYTNFCILLLTTVRFLD